MIIYYKGLFMKYLLSVFLSFVLISTAFAKNSEASETTLLVVYSPSCTHCHEWMKNVYPVYQSYKKEEQLNQRPSIRLLNMNNAEDSQFISDHLSMVLFTPTFVLWDGQKELYRFQGYSTVDAFFSKLDGGLRKINLVVENEEGKKVLDQSPS